MIGSKTHNWIEINANATLKYWDLPRNNLGIGIDVYDEDDNHLEAREHFHMQYCEEGKEWSFKF